MTQPPGRTRQTPGKAGWVMGRAGGRTAQGVALGRDLGPRLQEDAGRAPAFEMALGLWGAAVPGSHILSPRLPGAGAEATS